MLPSFIFSSLNIANRKTNIVTLTRIKFSFIKSIFIVPRLFSVQ